MRLPFFLSWWAFSFPVAAFTAATLVYSRFVDSPWMTALAAFMLGLSTLLIIWLLLRTVVAVVRHEPQLVD
jgi:tellurite resistance protein